MKNHTTIPEEPRKESTGLASTMQEVRIYRAMEQIRNPEARCGDEVHHRLVFSVSLDQNPCR